jgi:3,4-dihydroxy-2-butanone 4-phosphate synthase
MPAGVRRVRNDRVDSTVVADAERILTAADVVGIDASQAERFQMPGQVALAGAGLRD